MHLGKGTQTHVVHPEPAREETLGVTEDTLYLTHG